MKTIKQAALSLFKKGEISQDEYSSLIKMSSDDASELLDGVFNKYKPGNPKRMIVNLSKNNMMSKIISNAKRVAVPVLAGSAAIMVGKELLFDPIRQSIQHKNALESMVSKVPSLEGKDSNQMKEYFNIVKTFSPKSASNPLVAGALVNKMMEFGGVDHKLVQDISAIEQGLQRPSIFMSATENFAKTLGGAATMAGGL